jgi:stage IV sporulation protein A
VEQFDLYKDISERTQGDIYLGIVGPVRTGKSTFIKRFMDLIVIPNIENEHSKERTKDELPQSSAGKTIMTTEPKFVPNEAVEIKLDDDLSFKVRMIDCVGYLVNGASGYMDEEQPRMVNTPWADEKMPFAEAAEMGTRKVINEHSTIGVVITTDGSITDINREDYIESEERVINELKSINKPFVVLLNTNKPFGNDVEQQKNEMEEKYNVPVVVVNCAQIKAEEINAIMEKVLYEFPIKELKINFPKWIETLSNEHWLKIELISVVKEMLNKITKLREIKDNVLKIETNEHIKKAYIDGIKLGSGTAHIEISVNDDLFYKIISETTGMQIDNEYKLISTIKLLASANKEYEKIKYALQQVNQKGYGIVTPVMGEMKLEEPIIVRHGSKYGVKIKASAPSIHLIKADIQTEISPIVGTEQQSIELLEYLKEETKEDPSKIWELNMFGKSMHDLVKEGLQNKLYHMPEDAQMKLQETLQRIINEGSGGLICIIL